MLSRVANSIYWMSRYLERADNVARFIDVNAHLILDMGRDRANAQWEPLVYASGDEADFNARYDKADEKNVLRFLTFDDKNPNSILSCIQKARENARTVREVISSDMWEAINELYHTAGGYSRKRSIENLRAFLTEIKTAGHLIIGLIENTMSHNQGRHFALIGRMLERADKTTRLLDVKYFSLLPAVEYLDTPYDTVEWGAVLKSVDAFEMYRKQFHRANYRDVTQFLIFDPHFPRSVRFCLRKANRSLSRVAQDINTDIPALNQTDALQSLIFSNDIDSVLNNGLHEFADLLQTRLNEADASLYRSFFAQEAA